MSQPAQTVHLGVMVREEQRRELAALAQRQDRSISSVTRQAIDAWLEQQGRPRGRDGAER